MRQVKIFNTETNQQITIQSEATLWGQLKAEINASQVISAEGKTAIVRDTKAQMSFDDSVLPTGDFQLFLFPQKVKSGK